MKEDGPEKTVPVVVRKLADDYELVDGERRWEIATELGWVTIKAIEQQADDLQARALCISYNRWRGRLNWFKLYDVLKKDIDEGINVFESYREALSGKEIEFILSLGNLVPEARRVLEDSLKRYPEITLEQLHLLSLFPASQQESLVEKFKTPVVSQALLQALNPFLSKNQRELNANGDIRQQEKARNSNIRCVPERAAKSLFSEKSDKHLTSPQLSKPSIERKRETQKALLIEVSYDCECGRHYRANFKNLSIVTQKQNMLFEHVDMKPRTFQVHCDKCNSDHEFAVDGVENETKQILCRRCKPLPRKGILDVNTGEVTWLD
jgi:ParB-like chromosome segregation protein Spo0J